MKKHTLTVLTVLILTTALLLSACQQPTNPSEDSTGSVSAPSETNTGTGSATTAPSSSEPGSQTAESSTEEETLPPDTRIQFIPTQTSLFIFQNGTILSAEITGFDNSEFDSARYTEDGLRSMVLGWVEEFNKSVGRTAVSMESVTVADKKAKLVLSYDGAESFLAFQGSDFGVSELAVMTVGEAVKNGVTLSGMKNAAGEAVTGPTALEKDEWHLVAVTGKVLIVMEDQILYYSDFLTPTDEYSVRVSGDKTAYLIFK